ncbi:hypothetical protein P4S72_18370 [Vibrio sp. PP-XX7]
MAKRLKQALDDYLVRKSLVTEPLAKESSVRGPLIQESSITEPSVTEHLIGEDAVGNNQLEIMSLVHAIVSSLKNTGSLVIWGFHRERLNIMC